MSLLSPLNHLLKASSKQVVEKALCLIFLNRSTASSSIAEDLQTLLDLETLCEASDLCDAANECIAVVLYSNNIEDLATLFEEEGTDVNPKLKQLVGSIISNRLEAWREAAICNRVSLPRYVDMNWAISMKRASSQVLSF